MHIYQHMLHVYHVYEINRRSRPHRGAEAREEMNKMLLPDSRSAWATQHMNQNRDKALVQRGPT